MVDKKTTKKQKREYHFPAIKKTVEAESYAEALKLIKLNKK